MALVERLRAAREASPVQIRIPKRWGQGRAALISRQTLSVFA